MPTPVIEKFDVNTEAYNPNSWELRITGDFQNMRGLSLQGVSLLKDSSNSTSDVWTKIVYAAEVNENEMRLVLEDYADSIWKDKPPAKVAIQTNKYVGGIEKLSVLGKHYKTEDNGL